MSKTNKSHFSTSKYSVKGMHCASCEIVIEKKLNKESGVVSANVDLSQGQLLVKTDKNLHLSEKYLNSLFKNDGYSFSSNPTPGNSNQGADDSFNFIPYAIATLLLMLFYILQKTGFSSLVSVNSQSSLPIFFIFGLLAGLSTCAALVGGIILSLSKQWLSKYDYHDSDLKKATPHLLFNTGRVAGYAIFGASLGYLGTFFRLSTEFSAAVIIFISLVMIFLGLQMLGVKKLAKYQLRLPKIITRNFSNEENFKGKLGPLLMGALTFFLPCGFTITAQALALSSGSPLQGSLIMGLFALGTVPGLLAIGIGSVKLFSNPKVSQQFSIIAGILVLFFAGFNINSQLSVLGFTTTTIVTSEKRTDSGLVPVESGKQIIRMNASSSGYNPNRFKVKVGQVVRLEITDTGTSGCTNAVISKLWDGQISLTRGKTSIKEFTPTKVGVYKFSCWMGMVTGTIEVVD